MTGYDQKSLTLESSETTTITAEIDVTGMGDWHPYKSFKVSKSEAVKYAFPDAFQAYWIRFHSDTAATVSAQLEYQYSFPLHRNADLLTN